MELEVSTTMVDGIKVVRCRGRIKLGAESEAFERELAATGDRIQIVVNLEGVSNTDSSGVGAIARGLSSARKTGGDLKLCCLSSQPRALLFLTQILSFAEDFDTEAEAIAAFRPQEKGGTPEWQGS